MNGDRRRNDWNKLARGMPSTANIKDPEIRRVCEAIAQNISYLIKKVQDIRVPDVTIPRTNVTKRPARYSP
jgi:glutamate dehydrogenase/leucine dehydrogenase